MPKSTGTIAGAASIKHLILVVLVFVSRTVHGEDPVFDCKATPTIAASPPNDPSADPFGQGPWYINSDRTIWAGWDAVRLVAGGRNKVLWIRPKGATLQVSGKRLDGPAQPMTATIPCCYDGTFQVSGLEFPAAGCWEISAMAGSRRLTFITRVAKK